MDSPAVVLGVAGSIAAYKALEVTSALVQRGVQVRVVMTPAATRFVTPLSFESLSGHPVLHDLWAEQPDLTVSHVRLGDLARVLAIVPATADAIARLALGIADDALTATALATTAPLLLAPAMNRDMWRNPATQTNVATLLARGASLIGPDEGWLAEGIRGPGRLAAPAAVVDAILALLNPRRDLVGAHVVVTAGPTREAIDPVRYITNRSSGKMGYALAQAAHDRGADVTLISGPVQHPPPIGVTLLQVTTAVELLEAVQAAVQPRSTLIMAAAVADYAPAEAATQKLKRSGEDMVLRLRPTPDILRSLRRPSGLRVVAFAAETTELLNHAQDKLRAKGADLLVANDITEAGAGFDVDTNHVWILRPGRPPEELPTAAKLQVAHAILDATFAQ